MAISGTSVLIVWSLPEHKKYRKHILIGVIIGLLIGIPHVRIKLSLVKLMIVKKYALAKIL